MASGRVPDPLEAVEDEIEPEFELAHIVCAALLEVLLDVLDEVGVFVDGELPEEGGAGKVTPVIDRRYPLSEVPDAVRYLETMRARGKVVITVWGADP